MRPVGHEKALERLMSSREAVVLLLGPSSVGKTTMARWAASALAEPADIMIREKTTVDAVEEISLFVRAKPFGSVRMVVLRLTDASPEAEHALLLLLEDPPPWARFLLVAESVGSSPLLGRARLVLRVGLLAEGDVQAVLERLGVDHADRLARTSGGQVRTALEQADDDGARGRVLGALRALATHDRAALASSLRGWERRSSSLLRIWLAEALTGQWRLFDAEDGCGLDADRRTLTRLARGFAELDGGRSGISARAILSATLTASLQG